MSKQTRDRFLPYVFDFLVVVLGVTVSFGLDSWRTDRQQAQLHAQDIRSLLEDLERDQERIQEVEEHIKLGQESFDKILRITNKHRRGEMEYADFAAQLMELGTPYVYLTFYMNNSTYKSLLSNGRLQLFPESISKKLRDYYEYVSKRVEDNNDIVDQVTLRYYNEDHPWVNYKQGVETMLEIGVAEKVAENAAEDMEDYFHTPGVREHYSQLSFLHGTLSVHNQAIGIHSMQVEIYTRLRDELEDIIKRYDDGAMH